MTPYQYIVSLSPSNDDKVNYILYNKHLKTQKKEVELLFVNKKK